jgi:DNA-binding MarR family transcriptional regulator
METSKSHSLANELSIMAVRLIRWLRAADTGSALSDPLTSAMAVIVHSGGIAPSALAELEQVRRPTITKVVDELVSRGLVRRERHATDGRGTLVVATAEGLALWRAGQLRATAPLAERIEALDADELRRFEEALPLFARIMEPPAL